MLSNFNIVVEEVERTKQLKETVAITWPVMHEAAGLGRQRNATTDDASFASPRRRIGLLSISRFTLI